MRFVWIGLLVLVAGALAEDAPPYMGEITADRVNVRAGPSINYEILAVLGTGDTVGVRETDGTWCRIDLPRGAEAWMAAEFLETESKPPSDEVWHAMPAHRRRPIRAVVDATHLRVRARAKLDSSVIGRLDRGEEVGVLFVKDGWARVLVSVDVGASVHGDYVRRAGEYSPPGPLPAAGTTVLADEDAGVVVHTTGGDPPADPEAALAAADDEYRRAVATGTLPAKLGGIVAGLRNLARTADEPFASLAAMRVNELILQHYDIWDAEPEPDEGTTGPAAVDDLTR